MASMEIQQNLTVILNLFADPHNVSVDLGQLEWDDDESEYYYPCKVKVAADKNAPNGPLLLFSEAKPNGFIIEWNITMKDGMAVSDGSDAMPFRVWTMVAGQRGELLAMSCPPDLKDAVVRAVQAAVDTRAEAIVWGHAATSSKSSNTTRITLNPVQADKVLEAIRHRIDDPEATEIAIGAVETDRVEYRHFRSCRVAISTATNIHSTHRRPKTTGFIVEWDVVVDDGVANYETSKDSYFTLWTMEDGQPGCKLLLPCHQALKDILFSVLQSPVDNLTSGKSAERECHTRAKAPR